MTIKEQVHKISDLSPVFFGDGASHQSVWENGTEQGIGGISGNGRVFDMHVDSNNESTTIEGFKEKVKERVNHPDYYNLSDGPYIIVDGQKINIECIDVIRNMPTWKGNVIKYLWRCGEKQEEGLSSQEKELEDMEKALWYLQDKINEVKKHNVLK